MAYGILYLALCHIFIWHTYGTWQHYLTYGLPYAKYRQKYDFLLDFVCHMPYVYGILVIGNIGTAPNISSINNAYLVFKLDK